MSHHYLVLNPVLLRAGHWEFDHSPVSIWMGGSYVCMYLFIFLGKVTSIRCIWAEWEVNVIGCIFGNSEIINTNVMLGKKRMAKG